MNDTVVAHDPSWAEAFKAEAKVISSALAGMPIALHHIGSTAIPNILAKPIIDILGVVPQFDALDTRSAAMQGAGYQVMGAYGIDGRRYFRKLNPEGRRTHHLHVFLEGSQHITRHLAFRDFLTHYPET
ncbi:MAG: GrpB family protein, partial [Pseudomonadota bacterium]